MSRTPAAPVPVARPFLPFDRYSPAYRPTVVDFSLVMIGFALSIVLAQWSGFAAHATGATPAWVAEHLLEFLPELIFLPVGVLLFWPLYYLTQWVRGRVEPMSSGEWLWGVAWLAVLPWVAWVAWQHWDTPPDMLKPETFKRWIFLGYAVGVFALGSLAALIVLVGLLGRWRQTWTHSLCLVLLIWPALWLAGCLAWGIELK